MPNNDSEAMARSGTMAMSILANQRQSSHAPPASRTSSNMPKPGTKNFSNWARARWAGKNFRVLRRKQGRLAPGPGHFLDLQLLQPFVVLEPHLEPAGKRHERAQAQENRAGLAGQRVDITRHGKDGDENQRRRNQVYQTIFLNVAFHA